MLSVLLVLPDHSSMITHEFIKTCRKHKIKALAWDFLGYKEPLQKIKTLINMGIDGILFDDYKNISLINQWIKSKH